MRSTMLLGVCLLLMVATAAFASEAGSNQSAVGTWKLDVQKSSYGNMPSPKFEQLVVITDEPNSLKWRLTGAEAGGKTFSSSYDGPIDGKDHPMMSSEGGGTLTYTRTPSGGVHWVTKDKTGAVIETGNGALSADGRTLTLKGTVKGPKGESNFVSVFDKVK